MITKIINKLTKPYRNKDYYLDLTQDLYIEALKCKQKYNPSKGKFSTYLYNSLSKVIYNMLKHYVCIIHMPRYLNSDKFNIEVCSNITENNEGEINIYDMTPMVESNSIEIEHNLIIAKELLTDIEYRTLVLYIKGYTKSEISKADGVSRQAVDSRFKNIKNKLKGKYEEIV